MKFLREMWSYLFLVIVVVSLVLLGPFIYLWGWAHYKYQLHISGEPDPCSWQEVRARRARKKAESSAK